MSTHEFFDAHIYNDSGIGFLTNHSTKDNPDVIY